MASSKGKVSFRVGIYTPVYLAILGLMAKGDTFLIHAAKTKAL